MNRCVVGYAGGKEPNPTYNRIKDYTEAVPVEYDPSKVSYEELLFEFGRMHSPTSQSWSTQYRSAIWYTNEDQKEEAEQYLEDLAISTKKQVYTKLEPMAGTEFYKAEEYHQHYIEKASGKRSR